MEDAVWRQSAWSESAIQVADRGGPRNDSAVQSTAPQTFDWPSQSLVQTHPSDGEQSITKEGWERARPADAPPQAMEAIPAIPGIDDQDGTLELLLNSQLPRGQADANAPSVVIIDQQNHLTHVLQVHNNELEDVLTVPNSSGRSTDPTPNGRMYVSDKRLDPIWTPPTSIDPEQTKVLPYSQTHDNPLGVMFLRLSGTSIGMHGTNNPDSIGKFITHGCIRHENEDALKIYPLVKINTPVYIVPDIDDAVIRQDDVRI